MKHYEWNERTQQQLLRIPTGRRQSRWLFTSADKKLNQGLPGTNSTSRQNVSWTWDHSPDLKASILTTWPHCLLAILLTSRACTPLYMSLLSNPSAYSCQGRWVQDIYNFMHGRYGEFWFVLKLELQYFLLIFQLPRCCCCKLHMKFCLLLCLFHQVKLWSSQLWTQFWNPQMTSSQRQWLHSSVG